MSNFKNPQFLDELREANIARDKVWNPDNKLTSLFRAVELGGEVGELLNIAKKLEREALGLVGSRSSLAALVEELADIIICVDLIAMDVAVDLEEAVRKKFNKTSRERKLSVYL